MAEKPYSRVARVNQALREVIADELELIDDERLELVTVTGVRAEADFRHAVVWFDTLHGLEEVKEALQGERVRLQAAVGRQLRLRRTPELFFEPDPAIAAGSRVEEILRSLQDYPGTPAGKPPAEDGTS